MSKSAARILIVEDDDWLLMILHDILARMEETYAVLTAHTAAEALSLPNPVQLDLLITDLRLPDMEGQHLTEQLLARTEALQVIWITAYGCHRVRARADDLGIYRCLDKPLEVESLRQIVRKALSA